MKIKRKIQVHSETVLSKQSTGLEKRQNTAVKQMEGWKNARRLNEECAVTEIEAIEAARQAAATARAALYSHWTPRRNDALNAAVAAHSKKPTHTPAWRPREVERSKHARCDPITIYDYD